MFLPLDGDNSVLSVPRPYSVLPKTLLLGEGNETQWVCGDLLVIRSSCCVLYCVSFPAKITNVCRIKKSDTDTRSRLSGRVTDSCKNLLKAMVP